MSSVRVYAPTVDAHPDAGSLHDQWGLAMHIAGRFEARVAHRRSNGQYAYDTVASLTNVPSANKALAAAIYDNAGYCRTLCLDLDAKHGHDVQQVHAQTTALVAYLAEAGLATLHDVSPTGGRHVYIPLKRVILFDRARDIATVLKQLFPAIDVSPHATGIKTGCIRTPGARHTLGGHQQLTMPLAYAYDALMRRNTPDALEELEQRLSGRLDAVRQARTDLDTPIEITRSLAEVRSAQPNRMSAAMRAIAVDGIWDATRYGSSSEARQACLVAAVSCGYSLEDIHRHMADGTWPGLAYLYASRRSQANKRTALVRHEFLKAAQWITRDQGNNTPANTKVRRIDTSGSTQGGAPRQPGTASEHSFIRTWRATTDQTAALEYSGRSGHSLRWLMRSLAAAGHKTGDRYIAFGTRSLAEGCGTDHSTVANLLHELEADGWVELIDEAGGPYPAVWGLTLPGRHTELIQSLELPAGKARELPAAFHVLGHVPAWAFEAIAYGDARTLRDVARIGGMSKRAAIDAVALLEDWKLVSRNDQGLAAHPHRLDTVAREVGAYDIIAAQRAQHRAEREAWRAWLAEMAAAGFTVTAPGDAYAEATRDRVMGVAA